MVVIKIFGGLGNQMFQYAFSLNYILRGIEVKYDLSFYHTNRSHNGFELETVFPNIKMCKATARDMFYFIESAFIEGKKQYSLRPDRLAFSEEVENEFTYNAELLNMDNVYFSGYWQHMEYLNINAARLKRNFVFLPIQDTDSCNKNLERQLLNSNSVAIHIRRQDYLQSAAHLNIDLDYYTRSIDLFRSSIEKPLFFIFSDDMEWAKEHVHEPDMVFVQQAEKSSAFRDMQLMSICRHNIIANSTFSWWAAWLNNHQSKMVVAPAKWFTRDMDMDCLLLQNWIKL